MMSGSRREMWPSSRGARFATIAQRQKCEMSANPTVSVVMPAYKRHFLKEAISSILAQRFRNFELVVVDDDSPEDLYSVIAEFPWHRNGVNLQDGGSYWVVDGIGVRYYRNARNIGKSSLVGAWTEALKYANCEWCVVASDDDTYEPDYLSEMMLLKAKYPCVDLFHCRVAITDALGEYAFISEERLEFESQVQMAYARGVERVRQYAPEFFFRKSALDSIGGFVDFPLAWYSDDATWLKMAKNGVVCSPRVLLNYRASGDNITSRKDNIREKIVAANAFKLWFCEYSSNFRADSKEDCFKLANLRKAVWARTNSDAFKLASHLPLLSWIRAIKAMRLSWLELKDAVYSRFRILRGIRVMIKD